MQLLFTRRTVNTASIEVINDEGEPQYQTLLNRFKDKDIRLLARLWGESVPTVTAKLNEVCETESEELFDVIEFNPAYGLIESLISGVETIEASGTGSTDSILSINVRDIEQLRSHSVQFIDPEPGIALRKAFEDTWNHAPNPNHEFIVEWNDTSKLCCLDIDYHDTEAPTVEAISSILARVKPLPYCWHPTHGKGVKLYYVATPGYTAKELASVAGIEWVSLDCTATFDLIKSTRHPCYNRKRDSALAPCSLSDIRYVYGSSDLTSIKRVLLSETSQEDIETYLAEKGYSIGSTLPHTECPIDPTPDTKANVYVGDNGLFCHRCYARGLGSSPGFKGYGELIGSVDNRISLMVKNFCHLEHARVVLSNIYPNVPIKVLEDVYRVMLKIVHTAEDPRIFLAMKSGTGYIRIASMWVSGTSDSTIANGLPAFVNSLPATKHVKKGGEDAGKLIPDIPRTTAFLNDGNLEEYGYPDITFLRGCRIFSQFNKLPELVKVVSRKDIPTPRYVPPTNRMDVEESWQLLESEFPGINRNYVKLLISTKGASEGRLCQCPFLLVNGPSGAGKSTTVHIAAGICGDKADEPIWNANAERFRQALMDGVRSSGFICVNEVFKYADKAKVSYTQALDPMLSLTEDSRSHVLYVGSVPFGRLPVFVLTDINIPPEIIADRQLARRFQFFRLDNENFWTDTLVSRGIRPHQFRAISSVHNAASDSILSDVIDTYFLERMSLADIAKDLSGPDEYVEDVVRSRCMLTEFYQAVIKSSGTVGSHARRFPSTAGWKFIDRMHDTPLLSLWNEVCDGQEPDKWNRSRLVDSQDWSKLLNVSIPIICEYRNYKSQCIYIRFRSPDSSWVNGVDKIKPEKL